MTSTLLHDALIYLAAAIFFVPIAKRIGMGSVLGYLIGGIIIGPFCLGFVGGEGKDVMHFAEFGVVMMLFLIGLELEPSHLWRIRRLILGTGILQLGLTTLLFLAMFLIFGFSWPAALACGLALSMSSTAIVLQTLREKGLSATQSGRCSFAVLLFQDISVIPILALLPLLAVSTVSAQSGESGTLLQGLPGWAQTIALLLAVNLVVASGRFLIVPFLRFIARLHLQELFTASALFIVIATASLMTLVGLSPALGTFLAGVVLANSEYRHELESDIAPFKGVLLGLFFISVGTAVNFTLILNEPLKILTLVCAVIAIKFGVLALTGKLSRLSFDQNLLFSLGLAQVGEFAFVLFSFISQLSILSPSWTDTMMGVTALSMTVTPLLLMINERLILPRFGTLEKMETAPDAIDLHSPVIIAGFGHFGSTVGRFLRANGIQATILDNDSDRVDLLRKMGFRVFYGDATRVDILKAAGADQARILIAAIGSPEINSDLIEKTRKLFPHLSIMARAENRLDAYHLMETGITDIYRETLDTSVRLGIDCLVKLGFRRYSALRSGQNFIRYDEAAMQKLAPHRHDKETYIDNFREEIQNQEELLTSDRESNPTRNDHAWDSESLRKEFDHRR
ncbi:Kef-type potassium/proton antiporter, CPA2 family [Syntrophus gentianae]|uniref:Kef-type potassium/proton antiporter, CPA2 family n=1 Tax=Syntrophus gentianae TaxID=43775 RepID=A0A1H7ZAE4_9BACT|nr:monovalent cation:proton antiporter-2 (CPA2) family protein [Syntrophus gentianae]SEM55235.1 Kef-type potassium/proton antiporter, CPA2 family [Syntrophus gentianae]